MFTDSLNYIILGPHFFSNLVTWTSLDMINSTLLLFGKSKFIRSDLTENSLAQ